MQKFDKGIAENETDVMPKPRLVPKNHVYYPIKSRSSTAYLTIDAQCSHCKKSSTAAGKLLFLIKNIIILFN